MQANYRWVHPHIRWQMAGLSQTRERGPEIAADVGHIWTGRSLLSAERTQTSIRVKASLLSFKERDPGLHQKV